MPIHSILVLLSVVTILLSFAFFVVVDATVPATLDMSLFEVKRPYKSVDGYSPILKLGTFGYCIDWEYHDANATPSTKPLPMCFHGNDYDTASINLYFPQTYDYPIQYIARLTPAASALHPLNTALVFLVLATTALPCFVPPIFAVALSWLATASSVAAVGTTFSLALGVRSRVGISYFGYGFGIWALLVAAISTWVFTALLTTAWWLRRRSDQRNLSQTVEKSGPGHGSLDVDASVESQGGELSREVPLRELHEGEVSRKHELLNTDRRERGRAESGAEERYELETPQRTKF
ncbi:hypothetical protein FHL15_006745 [Xylaria flabelliformis]|uniref:Uncharacterized protein n=1 Tax=Xylaria flabelliformis TaxID=2512241 RepID=A0A553HWM7_9PEZI|nr:hypothetical protein FHL15_006745 [Xylaria flabelliformis]